MFNKNIAELKLRKFIPENANVAENYKQYLDPLPADFNLSDLTDDNTLLHTHVTTIQRYLRKSVYFVFVSVITKSFSLEVANHH